MRVAIGVPSTDMVYADFAVCLALMMHYTAVERPDIQIVGVINQKTSIIEKGRSDIVASAFELGAEALLFLDSDMMFPPQLLRELVNASQDIVGCNYTTRRRPLRITCRDEKGNPAHVAEKGLKEVGYIGTGALFIKMSVFEKIGKPYFTVKWDEEKQYYLGEDYMFCETARAAGFKVHCDFDLSKHVLHIGQVNYGI